MARRTFLCYASGSSMPCSEPDHRCTGVLIPRTHGAALSQRQVLADMRLRDDLAPERVCGLSISFSSVYNALPAIFYQNHSRNKRKQANAMPQMGSRGIKLLGFYQLSWRERFPFRGFSSQFLGNSQRRALSYQQSNCQKIDSLISIFTV